MNLIVPGARATPTLLANRDGFMTGFDLHKTLVGLIGGDESLHLAAPWALDLITQAIPRNRTCADAGVPLDFCSCANEYAQEHDPAYPSGNPHRPSTGTCNYAGYPVQKTLCVGAEYGPRTRRARG